ncbi:MAG: leucine--tRNA ligase [Elusimicrobiota bacterium]|jgi:leucyl-tRNA synthetase|nr:leucine--tRNA ligase [Elusimicrobiota bacterium]
MRYNFKNIEKKWQKIWDEKKIFEVKDQEIGKKNYFVLEMFPYPSGMLHMGHVRNYTISDLISRYKKLQGFNVMHPIGWDSFGLPAENAAIKYKKHPKDWTLANINKMKEQLKAMGFSYDWSREITTCLENYYKWNQWIFLKLYEKGLAYRKESVVNWCNKCKTVLANEQVENGKCWRCSSEVVQKSLEQWFFKITEYQEQLLQDYEFIKDGWATRIIDMQKNWIGKSEGTTINFDINNLDENIKVFTTRVDTLYGVTYIVIAPEHEIVNKFITILLKKDNTLAKNIIDFIESVKKQTELDRNMKGKEGIFSGFYAIHPFTNKKIPIWLGNYVLATYGTGAVMAVPAHDQRDYEFAIKNNLEIKIVITPYYNDSNSKNFELKNKAFEEKGFLVNSAEFDNLKSDEAKIKITEKLIFLNKGNFTKTYRLKDWLISRQRYWGTPIPIIYCKKCGIVPIKFDDLPVKLPESVDFTGQGDSPLKYISDFVNVKCPECGNIAQRETDTMDTFVDSSWYFLRYCDSKNDSMPFSKEKTSLWMPVNQYIGGAEHACMHLLYSRFFEKVFVDLGLVDKKAIEPFTNLLNQGMVIKDGNKMSKSKGNIVDPDEMLKKYGADSSRLFILFAAPPHKDLEWNEDSIEGANRFLNRFYRLFDEIFNRKDDSLEQKRNIEQMHNSTIKKILEDYENFGYNTIIATTMEAINFLYKEKDSTNKSQLLNFISDICILISPIVPHITEEIWQKLGNKESIILSKLPVFDSKKAEKDKIIFVIQINGKIRAKYDAKKDEIQENIEKIIFADEKLKTYLENKKILKKVFIKNKLINIVVK